MCAAPGGKTFQALNYGTKLDIIEINPKKSKYLERKLNQVKI